ncbi:MAG: hypothetical protein KF760_32540 [Candidatus Eremiobacteraeota bacterium]|nr:hypothetical protein [Candidatus Eremiobacteraeota bacterium]MCW5870338.1 hypothetical protein [Candidatus Eremiobacteraeota bacterium]
MKIDNIRYQEPIIQRTLLGQKPANVFNDSPTVTRDYVSVGEALPAGDTASVWGDIPHKHADGTPQLREVVASLDLNPRSPIRYGLIAAGIGAAVGALAGLAAAPALGLSSLAGSLAGGAGLAALAGGGAALAVRGDQVKVVWTRHDITDHKLIGYREFVGPGQKNGQPGYFHRFVPDVQATVIGTYSTPAAVHYKEEAK